MCWGVKVVIFIVKVERSRHAGLRLTRSSWVHVHTEWITFLGRRKLGLALGCLRGTTQDPVKSSRPSRCWGGRRRIREGAILQIILE